MDNNTGSNNERIVGGYKGVTIVDSGESLAVLSQHFSEPMWGDYRGCEMAVIRYIPSRRDSRERALELAWAVLECATKPSELLFVDN